MLQHLPKVMLLAICFFAAEITSQALAYKVEAPPAAMQVPAKSAPVAPPTQEVIAALQAGAREVAANGEAGHVPAPPPPPPLKLRLMGTVVGSSVSLATLLTSEGKTVTLAAGQTLKGCRLTSVEAERVWFGDIAITTKQATEVPAAATGSPEPPPVAAQTSAAEIVPPGQTPTRGQLREALNDAAFLTSFRTEREEQGLRMTFRGDNHLFARLGLKSGDLLTSVNEEPLNSLESMAELLHTLQNTDNFKLKVLRAEGPLTLRLQLED